jgi:hypothetical protein
MAAQGIGSAVVLNLLLWVGPAGSILGGAYNPLYATAALVGVVLLGGFSAVVVLLMRGEEGAARVLRTVASRVPFLDEESADRFVLRVAARLQTLVADRRRLVRGSPGTSPSGCARPPRCGCSWPPSATGPGSTG